MGQIIRLSVTADGGSPMPGPPREVRGTMRRRFSTGVSATVALIRRAASAGNISRFGDRL